MEHFQEVYCNLCIRNADVNFTNWSTALSVRPGLWRKPMKHGLPAFNIIN